ncbi:hypothetical protein SCHPADRAFT_895415 [Schizopora paradoxa]|uniref:Uncharacterized protein n=1 Tax=Schizopora paradoxa TaxID=27342 RepID=A0A0H2RNS9_9AGAM|nr:hypothetical protein SCHPADRAFT_895415 [Schizopora paradoxa]
MTSTRRGLKLELPNRRVLVFLVSSTNDDDDDGHAKHHPRCSEPWRNKQRPCSLGPSIASGIVESQGGLRERTSSNKLNYSRQSPLGSSRLLGFKGKGKGPLEGDDGQTVASSSKKEGRTLLSFFGRFRSKGEAEFEAGGKGKGKGKERAHKDADVSSSEEDDVIIVDGKGHNANADDNMIVDSGFLDGSFAEQQEAPPLPKPIGLPVIPQKCMSKEEKLACVNEKRRKRRNEASTGRTVDPSKFPNYANFIVDQLQHGLSIFAAPENNEIETLVSQHQAHNSRRSFDDDSELWKHILHGHGRQFLEIVAGGHPLQIDMAQLEAKSLISKRNMEADPQLSKYYIRTLSCTRDKLVQLLSTFIWEHPAETAWCIRHLAVMHVSYAEIRKIVNDAFHSLDLGDVASIIFETVTEEFIAPFRRIPIDDKGGFTLPYMGMTIAVTPRDRLADDQAAKDGQSRETNLLKVAASLDIACETYCISPLSYRVSSPQELRSNPTVGHIEAVIIACLRGIGSNSALGGLRCEYLPSASLTGIGDACVGQSVASPAAKGTSNPVMGEKLGRFFLDERNLFRDAFGDRKHMSDAGFRSTTAVAGAGLAPITYDFRGEQRTLKLVCLKDISSEDQQGKIGPINSDTTGRSTQAVRDVSINVNKEIPRLGNIELPTFQQLMGIYMDFFRFLPGHTRWLLSLLFSKRLFNTYNPLLFVTWSNPVLAAILSGEFETIYDLLPEGELRTNFLNGSSSRELAALFADTSPIPTMNAEDYAEHVGKIYIIQFGKGEDAWCKYIPIRDFGSEKYDPVLSTAFFNVQFLALVAIEVVNNTLLRNLNLPTQTSKSTWEFLFDIKIQSEAILREHGWEKAMEDAKATLRLLENTVKSLRWCAPNRKPPQPFDMPERRVQLRAEPLENGARLRQYEELQAIATTKIKNRFSPRSILWRPSFMSDEDAKKWFLALKPGTNVIASAASYGRTPEGQDRARESQRAFGQHGRTYAATKNQVLPGKVTTKNEQDEINRIPGHIAKCLEQLSDPKTPKSSKDASLERTWRYTVCNKCSRLVLGHHSGSYHHCGSDKISVAEKNFPCLTRINYLHDVLHNSLLFQHIKCFDGKSAFTIPGTKTVLVPLRAKDVLKRNSQRVPPASYEELLGDNLLIWVRRDEDNEDRLLSCAFDLAIPLVSRTPDDYLPYSDYDQGIAWRGGTMKKIAAVLTDREMDLYLVKCNFGHRGVYTLYKNGAGNTRTDYFQHTCESTLAEKKKETTGKRTTRVCTTTEKRRVTELLELPPIYLRSLLIFLRRSDEKFDLSSLLLWSSNM